MPHDNSPATIVTTEASTSEFAPLVDDIGVDWTFFDDAAVFAGSRSLKLDTHKSNPRASELASHLRGTPRSMPIACPAVFVSLGKGDDEGSIVDRHGRLLDYARNALGVTD